MLSSRIRRVTPLVYNTLCGPMVPLSVVKAVPGTVVNAVLGFHHPGWKSLPSTVKVAAFSTSADKPTTFNAVGNKYDTSEHAIAAYTDSYPDGRPVFFAVKDEAGFWGVEPKEVNRETSEFLGPDPDWSTVAHAHSGFPVRFYSSREDAKDAIKEIKAEEAKPLFQMKQEILQKRDSPRKRFLYAGGSRWELQGKDEYVRQLSKAVYRKNGDVGCFGITANLTQFIKGENEAKFTPIVSILSGSGTGKSRFLEEFAGIVKEFFYKPEDLAAAGIDDLIEVKVAFENGSSIAVTETDGDYLLGGRILNYFGVTKWRTAEMDPSEALAFVKEVLYPDQTVGFILCVDGVHQATDDKRRAIINALSNVNCSKTVFTVVAVAATSALEVLSDLEVSSQKLVDVNVSVSHDLVRKYVGENVITARNPLIQYLIAECGKHPRALEILYNVLSSDGLTTGDFVISEDLAWTIARTFHAELTNTYSWYAHKDFRKGGTDLMHAVLSRKRFPSLESVVFRDNGIDWTVDKVAALGLFSYNRETKLLECAPVVMWLIYQRILSKSNIPGTTRELFAHEVYQSVLKKGIDEDLGSSESFERFCAHFRALRSLAYSDDELVTLGDVHRGALFADEELKTTKFWNKHLELVHEDQQSSTKSTEAAPVSTLMRHRSMPKLLQPNELSKYVVISYPQNKGADSYTRLDLEDGKFINECHQMKRVTSKNVTTKDLVVEVNKACAANDVLVLYAVRSIGPRSSLEQTKRVIFVGENERDEYFGSGYQQCFSTLLQEGGIVYINFATTPLLRSIPGLIFPGDDAPKPTLAACKHIMESQQEKPFTDMRDFEDRVRDLGFTFDSSEFDKAGLEMSFTTVEKTE